MVSRTQPSGPLCLWQCLYGYSLTSWHGVHNMRCIFPHQQLLSFIAWGHYSPTSPSSDSASPPPPPYPCPPPPACVFASLKKGNMLALLAHCTTQRVPQNRARCIQPNEILWHERQINLNLIFPCALGKLEHYTD